MKKHAAVLSEKKFRHILCAVLLLFFAVHLQAEIEFEIVNPKAPVSSKTFSSSSASSGSGVEFEIVSKPGTKKTAAAASEAEIDDPDFEIVRRGESSGTPGMTMEEYKKKKEEYDGIMEEKNKLRHFGPFRYHPLNNTINGMDARLFFTLFVLSLVAVAAMFYVLIKEYAFTPPVYAPERMMQLRSMGYAQVPSSAARTYVTNLWNNATAGKTVRDDEYIDISSRGELHILTRELQMTAVSLPDDGDSLRKLNRIADSICFWKKRYLISPGISIDSGIVKRIFMGIVYAALLYIYIGHPMYLLVVFSPLAFLTPAYLADAREGSLVYRMLGGSLKLFGKMTGSALDGAARMEGATVTVYKSSYGGTYVEHNYWGVLIVFGLKIAFALFFLYLVYCFAPVIILYAVIRNYILAR